MRNKFDFSKPNIRTNKDGSLNFGPEVEKLMKDFNSQKSSLGNMSIPGLGNQNFKF